MLTNINPQCSYTTLHYTTLHYTTLQNVARHDALHKNDLFCIVHCKITISYVFGIRKYSVSEGGFHCREYNEWLALSQVKKSA